MTPSAEHIERTKKQWELIAGEALELDYSAPTIFAFGSELATLRLLKAFRSTQDARAEFSKNLNTHYFALTIKF